MKLIREITNAKSFKSGKDVFRYLSEFAEEDREFVIVLGLDTKNCPVYREVVSIGTLNSCLVHPREVFKKAITFSCNALIFAHNHPSGNSEPSEEDKAITRELIKAGEVLKIKVLDSLIFTKNEYYSIVDDERCRGLR
jgi:DNA repair protein RadC